MAAESILLVCSILPNNEQQITDTFSETCQTSKIESVTKKVSSFYSLTTFAKHSILDVSQGAEYASGLLKLLCRGSKKYVGEGIV